MDHRARMVGRESVRLSAALAARVLHDAGAEGALVRVTDPRTVRALERGFLHLLGDTRRPRLMPVSDEVAGQLRAPGESPLETGGSFRLALAFDRFGRGTFLLRRVPGEGAAEARRAESQMVADLERYLRGIASAEEGEESGGE